MVVTISEALQIEVPADIAAQFQDVKDFSVTTDGRVIYLQPAEDSLRRIHQKLEALGITEQDIREAVEEVRAENRSVPQSELDDIWRMAGTRLR